MMMMIFSDYLKKNRLSPLAVVAVVTPLSGCLVFLFLFSVVIIPQECC
jgi:hypothetical protein